MSTDTLEQTYRTLDRLLAAGVTYWQAVNDYKIPRHVILMWEKAYDRKLWRHGESGD